MNKLEWCRKKKKGIKIVEPNSNLAEKHIEKAENSLKTMEAAPTQDWKISAAYYTCYHGVYALLQKTGITSKIHSCTIEMMKFYDFTKSEQKLIRGLKDKREKAQYHVNSCSKKQISKKKETKSSKK